MTVDGPYAAAGIGWGGGPYAGTGGYYRASTWGDHESYPTVDGARLTQPRIGVRIGVTTVAPDNNDHAVRNETGRARLVGPGYVGLKYRCSDAIATKEAV